MAESDSSINFDNLGKIYNFLLGKDEKDLLSSLTPNSLETCLKIAQFYAGEAADKTILAQVADCTLEEFKQKNAIKEKDLGESETAQQNSPEKTAHELYQKLHPAYRYKAEDETSTLLSLPRELREVEILLKLRGKDLARASGVATALHEDIHDKTGFAGMNLMKRVWLEKAKSLDPTQYMWDRIAIAQIAIHDFEGAEETMKDFNEDRKQELYSILIKEKAQAGDFEGAIRMALQRNEIPAYENERPRITLYAATNLFLIAEIQAKKGMKKDAETTFKLGEELISTIDKRADSVVPTRSDRFLIAIICGYACIGKIKEAEEKATAIADDDQRSSVQHLLIDFKAKSGDIQGAKDLANQLDHLITSFISIAEIQLEANDREGASKTVGEAIGKIVELEKQNDLSLAYYEYPNLIRILIRLNDMPSALFYYQKLSLTDALTHNLITPLVEGLASNGEIEKVKEITNYGTGYIYLYKAALICAQKGNLKQAIDLWEDAGKLDQSWVPRMLVAAGEFQRAKEEIAKSFANFSVEVKIEAMRSILLETVKEQAKRGKIDDALQTIAEMEQLPAKNQLSNEVIVEYRENLAEAYLALAGFGKE